MKRIISILLSAFFVIGLISISDAEETKYPDIVLLIGDMDGNGTVEAADARLALRTSVGLENIPDEFYVCGDVDYTGEITSADARLILRKSVGLEEFAPIEKIDILENEPIVIRSQARAYLAAAQNGFVGTVAQWLETLSGKDGKSAYELAVEAGFTGTEEEWLASLKGADGTGIANAYITSAGHLILVLSNGVEIDAGLLPCTTDPMPVTFTVTFTDYDGSVLKIEKVEQGQNATPPSAPSRQGFIFTGWIGSYSKISKDTVITAEYKEDKAESTFAIENIEASAGDIVKVAMDVYNNPGVAGAKLTLSYDPLLTLVEAVPEEAFSVLQYTNPGKFSNPCNFTWDSESGMATENGTVLVFTFIVSDKAQSGDKLNISCSYALGDIYDEDLNDVVFAIENGVVTIQ